MGIPTLYRFIFTIYLLPLLFFSCKSKNSKDAFFKELCFNNKAKFKTTDILDLQKNEQAEVISALNYRLENFDLNTFDNLLTKVQNIIKLDENLKVVPNYDSLIIISKIPNDQLITEIFIRTNSSYYNTLSNEELKKVKEIIVTFEGKNFKEWYNFLRLINLLSSNYIQSSQIEKAIATYSYGLYKIENSEDPSHFKHFKDQFLSSINILFLREENAIDYINSINKIEEKKSNAFKSSFTGLLHRAYLEEELRLQKLPNQHLNFLKKALHSAQTKSDSVTIFLNLGVYYSQDTSSNKDQKYFSDALDLYKKVTCSTSYFRLLLSVLEKPLSNQEAYLYLNLLDSVSICPESIQAYVRFVKPQYIDNANRSGQKETILNELFVESENGAKSFPGRSSLHLQDYFISNLSEICNIFTQGEYVATNINQIIINKFLEVRLRDIHRQTLQNDNINSDSTRIMIKQILLSVNNLKNLKPFNNRIYNELFNHLVLQEKPTDLDEFFKMQSFHTDSLVANECVINFMKSGDNYLTYLYNDGQLQIFKFSVNILDSLLIDLNQCLVKREDIHFDNTIFSEINQITNNKDICIIADGFLLGVPLEYVFAKANKVFHFSNVKQILKKEIITINNNELQLFSFSSNKTIDSRKMKLYQELPLGLKEVSDIKKICKVPESNVVAGYEFTMEKITKSKAALIHISSHAKSDNTNRLNNYILTKNGEQKIFGFDLYGKSKLPKVVILSACESGIGVHATGAGTQTLSRAFLDNGTQTVIKTLWKVNEKATAEFMIEMYTHWVTGISLYDALEKTKNNFKEHEEYAHPYYWAGFVLEGNPHVYLEQTDNSDN